MYTVLLLDDEPWGLAGLRDIINWRDEGFEIVQCMTDPLQALDYLRQHPVDLVFTDIRMPYLSGLELMQAARQEQIPCDFVVVSAYGEFDFARQVIQIGALDYILKPLSKDEIIRLTERLRDQLSLASRARDAASDEPALPRHDNCLCYVALCEGDLPASICAPSTRMRMPDGSTAHWIASEHPIEPLFAAHIRCENATPLGISRSRRGFAERQLMLDDAELSLRNGFIFSSNEMIASMQHHIATNLGGKLSLRDIAESFHLSRTYLSGLFKRHTGQNIMSFVTHLRMRRAAAMLTGTTLSVNEIAGMVGYTNQCYFGKVFRDYYGASPSAYRISLGTTNSISV